MKQHKRIFKTSEKQREKQRQKQSRYRWKIALKKQYEEYCNYAIDYWLTYAKSKNKIRVLDIYVPMLIKKGILIKYYICDSCKTSIYLDTDKIYYYVRVSALCNYCTDIVINKKAKMIIIDN